MRHITVHRDQPSDSHSPAPKTGRRDALSLYPLSRFGAAPEAKDFSRQGRPAGFQFRPVSYHPQREYRQVVSKARGASR